MFDRNARKTLQEAFDRLMLRRVECKKVYRTLSLHEKNQVNFKNIIIILDEINSSFGNFKSSRTKLLFLIQKISELNSNLDEIKSSSIAQNEAVIKFVSNLIATNSSYLSNLLGLYKDNSWSASIIS
jgi:hypothetical protein